MKKLLIGLLVVGWFGTALTAGATNRYVSATSASPTPPYTNWTTAAVQIQDALGAAKAGDTIWVTNGTYTSTGALTNGAMLNLTNSVTVKSMNGAGATIINGGYPGVVNRCVYIGNAGAILEGFTLRGGYAAGNAPTNNGGGCYIGLPGTLRNCLVIGNIADGNGGGVYMSTNGSVVNCTISSNTAAGAAGGLYAATNGTVLNSIIYFNTGAADANYRTNAPVTFSYNCATPLPIGTGNTANDPLFVDVANTNFHIKAGSPCINACPNDATASWAYNLARDLDGQDRIIGGFPDMGVDEFTRYYYVSKNGANANVGSAASPWLTVNYGVTNLVVTNGDTILVGEGLYVENVNYAATGKSGLTVIGGYNTNDWSWSPTAHPTIIKATSSANDVITWNTAPQTLMGVTLTGGNRGIYDAANINNTRFTVAGCIISNNAAEGILINGSKCALFAINDLIVSNGTDGIGFHVDNAAYGSPIYNCTIANNGGNGIYLNYNTIAVDIRNCVISRNGKSGLIQNPAQTHQSTTVSYSTIYGHTIGGDILARPDSSLRGSQQQFSAGLGMMTADPRFVGGGDCHLSSVSPGVGNGADLTSLGVTTDLEGNPRSPPYDMGCYKSTYTAAPRLSATFVDSTAADDTNDGSSWGTAKKTIGTGLALTASNGLCQVAAGTYRENLFIPNAVSLSGAGRELTIVANTGAWHIATFADGNGKIAHFKLTGGIRGVDILSQNNTVEDCILANNKYGLAYVRMLSVLNNSMVTNNTYNGIWGINPGAIGMHNPALVARNCLIARNGDSGIYTAWDNGGNDHTFWLNCTIESNTLHGYQAAVYGQYAYFTNTLLAYNGGYATFVTGGGNPLTYLDYDCVYGNIQGTHTNQSGTITLGAHMVNADPQVDGTYHLIYGSPCVDAGKNIASITNDLDGTARASTNTFDIGAYESAFAPPPHYDAVYVDASMPNDTGAGTNWTTAKKTIGAAITLLTSTGTVFAASGLYNESVSIPANNTVAGTNWTSTIISSLGSVVTMGATNSRLRDVTVAGGTYGIAMAGPQNFATHCLLRNNSGSGVYITVPSNRVDQCVMRNNQYGIWVNTAVSCNYTVDRCTVASNTSHGIYQQGSSGNSPGGIILDSLVVNNGGDGFSSWTDNSSLSTWIYNCTFANNTGNGIYDNYLTTATDIRNCIVYGNATCGIRQGNTSHSTLGVTSCCVFSNAQGNFSFTLANGTMKVLAGCMSADPLFVGGNDYHLQANSPCLGYGITNGVLGVAVNDLDGVARSAPFDMGCYESAASPVTRTPTQYVNGASGNDAADGTTPGTAKLTIGSGLALTAPSGTCYVAAGTYRDTVILPAMVALEGADPATTIITSAWHVACMPETNSTIRKVTLQNGDYGVYQNGKYDTIDQCALRYNSIGFYLDGVAYSGWAASINRTAAISNSSHGVYVSQAGLTAINCLFAKNGGDGVFISADNSGVYSHMNFCTFADNNANGYEESNPSQWATTLTNCIASGNATNGIRFVRLNNDAIGYSCVYGNAGGDFSSLSLTIGTGMITNQLPLFHVDALGNKYALAFNSPCLDCGLNIGITNDLVGVLRPLIGRKPLVGSGYDLGAYEYVRPPNGSIFAVQ